MIALGKGWAQHVETTQKQSNLDRKKSLDRFSPVFIVMCVCEQPVYRSESVQSTMFTLHFLPFTATSEQLHKLSQLGLDEGMCPGSVVHLPPQLSNQQCSINSECQGEELACEGPGSVE